METFRNVIDVNGKEFIISGKRTILSLGKVGHYMFEGKLSYDGQEVTIQRDDMSDIEYTATNAPHLVPFMIEKLKTGEF